MCQRKSASARERAGEKLADAARSPTRWMMCLAELRRHAACSGDGHERAEILRSLRAPRSRPACRSRRPGGGRYRLRTARRRGRTTMGTPSREQLLHSLYEAAELEHDLMCTYLYAAFSIRTDPSDGIT